MVPRRSSMNAEYRGGLPPGRLRLVLEYVEAHLQEDLNLHRLAGVVEMSLYHFGRLFKQSTGLAPHQYVLAQRILKAKQLLADPHRSIAEISRQVGFSSRAHFSVVFRKQVGTTPRGYRRRTAQ